MNFLLSFLANYEKLLKGTKNKIYYYNLKRFFEMIELSILNVLF
jgi:hypothetical protein